MPRLKGSLHGLKADPSARSDDQDFRHGVMLLVGLAWLIVMCNAGSRTARRVGGLNCISRRLTLGKSRPPYPQIASFYGRDERGGANGGTAAAAKADSPNGL